MVRNALMPVSHPPLGWRWHGHTVPIYGFGLLRQWRVIDAANGKLQVVFCLKGRIVAHVTERFWLALLFRSQAGGGKQRVRSAPRQKLSVLMP